jgi:LacI family transcriptional regulator
MAVGVLAALREDLGKRVPGDVSVVGYDDLWFSADVEPPLTTVRLPLEDMGAKAMTMVLGPAESRPHRLVVPAELVVRASTGPRPGRTG